VNGDITRQEEDLFYASVGTSKLSYDLNRNSKLTYIALFYRSGPNCGSWKEPDLFFRAKESYLPTIAVECGWSESKEQLHKSMELY
jgi:hypothetical protein